MVADLGSWELGYLCNRGPNGPERVTPGLHGVTNGMLDAHWVKVSSCRQAGRQAA